MKHTARFAAYIVVWVLFVLVGEFALHLTSFPWIMAWGAIAALVGEVTAERVYR